MCSRRECKGVHDRAKEGWCDRYKKMTAPLKRASPAVIFTGVPTTVKRRNFRNSTSRRLFLTLRRAVMLPEPLLEGSENREAFAVVLG